MYDIKQVILVRTDLKMGKGKIAAQTAHASVEAVMKTEKEKVEVWKKQGMKKVVLKVRDLDELMFYKDMAEKRKLKFALITDAGKTQIESGTVTTLAIGPDFSERIDKMTGDLKIL